jgi:hypothetical protein
MSVYSLDTQTTFKYYKNHRDIFLDLCDKEYSYSHFLLGEKVNKKKQMFSAVMLELLCTENCELLKYIDDKLQGRLDKKLKPLSLITLDEPADNITIIETPMIWTDTQW